MRVEILDGELPAAEVLAGMRAGGSDPTHLSFAKVGHRESLRGFA